MYYALWIEYNSISTFLLGVPHLDITGVEHPNEQIFLALMNWHVDNFKTLWVLYRM